MRSDTLQVLIHIIQVLRQEKTSAAAKVVELYEYLFENRIFPGRRFSFSGLEESDVEELRRAFAIVEEIIAQYARQYYDSRAIPVTYYKRERRVRRHLDQQFSLLFKEMIRRSGQEARPELITEEPIYYLMQLAREKRFPRSKDGRASLGILRSRLHLDLSHRVETGPESRRVLLPHEIR